MRRVFIKFASMGLLLLLCCAQSALADAVILKDGSRLEGDVKRTETGWTVTSSDGKSTDVAANDVETIEVGGGKPTDATVASNLASLRRSCEVVTSPALAIERYQRFLTTSQGTPSYDDAKRDMAVWQDRLNRKLIKVGTQWVSAQQKAEMASQANTVARQALDLIKQGRTREAAPLIQQALDADPQNPAALYLRGLSQYDQNQIVAARKAFEGVIAALVEHAPSFNNLAIILWRQNQRMGSMRFYEQGMIASPVNKAVLDNVAEALAALPEDEQHNPLAVRVFKRFAEQDAQLQEIMAQSGWHRWGSTWVDQPTLDKLKLAEQEVKDKLDKIAADETAIKAKIADIDSSIDGNTRSMNQMAANSMIRDAKGNFYQEPLPGEYYTMQNDNERLTADRAAQEQKLQQDDEDAKKVQQSMPVPQYTGIQHMIGVDGTPFPPTTAPSTAPTTGPAAAPMAAPGMAPPVLMPLP